MTNASEAEMEDDKTSPSEALYAFAGWLTTRDEPVTMSAKHDAGAVANLVLEQRGGEGFVRAFIERLLGIPQLTSEELDELVSDC